MWVNNREQQTSTARNIPTGVVRTDMLEYKMVGPRSLSCYRHFSHQHS